MRSPQVIGQLEQLIAQSGESERSAALRKLELLRVRLAESGRAIRLGAREAGYFERVLQRLGRPR